MHRLYSFLLLILKIMYKTLLYVWLVVCHLFSFLHLVLVVTGLISRDEVLEQATAVKDVIAVKDPKTEQQFEKVQDLPEESQSPRAEESKVAEAPDNMFD
jgi:hypothetical protein